MERKEASVIKKTNEMRVQSIDLEKMITLVREVVKVFDSNKKIRVVLEHNPENAKSTIEIFKEGT